MQVTIRVAGVEQVVGRLQGKAQQIRASLVLAMRAQWFRLQTYIVTRKLSGQVLNRRTGVLASSIHAGGRESLSTFRDDQSAVSATVGTAVFYGAIHEYGGSFRVRGHARHQDQAFGRPTAPYVQQVGAYSITFPERSFLRSGFRDLSGSMRQEILNSVRRGVSS